MKEARSWPTNRLLHPLLVDDIGADRERARTRARLQGSASPNLRFNFDRQHHEKASARS